MSVGKRTVDDASSDTQAGAAGKAAVQRREATQDGSAGATDDSPSASDGGSAGEGATSTSIPPSRVDQKAAHCDLNTSCVSNGDSALVTCGVESTGVTCEFEGFVGATANVASGQRVVVGTACCGGCGCTPVEVYYDGANCWQGMPQCTLPLFIDQMYDPHPTTKPNPTFTPPNHFYLGSGGIGGSAPTATAGATSSGGTPGTESGGAPAAGAPTDAAGTGGASAGTGGASAGTGGSVDSGGASAGTGGSVDSGGATTTAGAPTTPEGGSSGGL